MWIKFFSSKSLLFTMFFFFFFFFSFWSKKIQKIDFPPSIGGEILQSRLLPQEANVSIYLSNYLVFSDTWYLELHSVSTFYSNGQFVLSGKYIRLQIVHVTYFYSICK